MSVFEPAAATDAAPDPSKHVNYTQGMVLGEDDLKQEFAYLAERDRWSVRELSGYGTVWGLSVSTQLGTDGPEVRVTPGVAVTPRGQLVHVTPLQCARLNDWLASRTTDVNAWRSGNSVTLYLTLSYRDCLTDLVPIAGEPCRSVEESMAPSRIADNFDLELRFAPPRQEEEDAVVDFVRWLSTHIDLGAGPSVPLASFLATIKNAIANASPPTDPDASPPLDYMLDLSPPGRMAVAQSDAYAYLRAALRLWVTDLRPLWRPGFLAAATSCDGQVTPPTITDGDTVLLAQLTVPIVQNLGSPVWLVSSSGGPIGINCDVRPFVLDTRLIEELWLRSVAAGGSSAPAPGNFVERATTKRLDVLAAGTLKLVNGAGGGYNNLNIVKVTTDALGVLVMYAFNPVTGFAGAPQAVSVTLQAPAAFVTVPVAQLAVQAVDQNDSGGSFRVTRNGGALAPTDVAGLQASLQIMGYLP